MVTPIRILEIVNVMDRAGLETMLMNHYRNIDRDVIQLDFLTHRSVAGAYDDEIRELGGRVFHAPRLYPQNCLAYRRYMRSFFSEHDYPVVHSHIDAMSAFPLAMARSCRVTVRGGPPYHEEAAKNRYALLGMQRGGWCISFWRGESFKASYRKECDRYFGLCV